MYIGHWLKSHIKCMFIHVCIPIIHVGTGGCGMHLFTLWYIFIFQIHDISKIEKKF